MPMPTKQIFHLSRLALPGVCLLLSGCVRALVHEAESGHYDYEPKTVALVAGFGLILVLSALRTQRMAPRVLLFIVGTAILVMAPARFFHFVTVDRAQIESVQANWWDMQREIIPFDQILRIERHTEQGGDNAKNFMERQYLLFYMKQGGVRKIPRTRLTREAEPLIYQIAVERGLDIKGDWPPEAAQ